MFSIILGFVLLATGVFAEGSLISVFADDDPILTVSSSIDSSVILVGDTVGVTIDILGNDVEVEDRIPLDIILVFDSSGSMAWDMAGNRIHSDTSRMEYAEDAAVEFVTNSALSNDSSTRLGVISFGGSRRTVTQLDDITDYDEDDVRDAIRSPSGGTPLGDPVLEAIAMMNADHAVGAQQIIILMTDGEHNQGSCPYAAADSVATNGMIMHAVAFGLATEEAMLIDLANRANGAFHSAPTGDSLGAIFDALATDIRQLVAEDVEVTYVLEDGIEYVPGSATVEPTSINGQTLVWDLGTINKDELVSIDFDVRPLVTGTAVAINTTDSEVTYNQGEIGLIPLEAVQVVSGRIEVNTKDVHGNDVENAYVHVRKISCGTEYSGNTDTLGMFSIDDLSSGDYEITITPPTSFLLPVNTFNANISPASPTATISSVLQPNEIENALITDIDGDFQAYTVDNGVVNAIFTFDLARDVDSVRILLNTEQTVPTVGTATFTNNINSIFVDGTSFTPGSQSSTYNEITINGSLMSGTYTLNVSFFLGTSAVVGNEYKIDVVSIEAELGGNINTYTIDYEIPLLINVVDDPSLY
ncbi:MAG: VWA domain-containing protein [Alkaliphilus sp.]